MENLDIGNRMKGYERVSEILLPKRIPVIIRIDGRAFHTVTRKLFGKKYSDQFLEIMIKIAQVVSKEIQGCKLCYCQSDEISFLLTDYKTIKTNGWFSYDLRKLISITASLASSTFSLETLFPVSFDSRAFSMPQDDICNYFIWRQLDATRNAIQMAGQEKFSHKQLMKKSCKDIQDMLLSEHKINFDNYPTIRKRGFCIIDGKFDYDIPVFSKHREYIERFIYIRED